MANDNNKQLTHLLDEIAVKEGTHPTLLEGVQISRVSKSVSRFPMLYQPKILFVGQGRKRAYLGGDVYQYDAYNYLVLSVPLPAECEIEASPESPLLGLSIALEPTLVGEMMLEMDEFPTSTKVTPRGIYAAPMNEELGGAVIRLLECLKSPLHSRMLGPQTVREIVFRVLCGEQGSALRAMASRDDHFMRISRVLKSIHVECAKPLSAEEMAKRAGMSVSVFNHHFRLVTASSPLQYLKHIRLNRARNLMIHDGYNASMAARAVGYESPSQFSREFKRLFGVTPIEDVEQARARLTSS